MSSNYYQYLLADFSRYIGIAELSFDQDHMCYLHIDDTYILTLRYDEDRQAIILLGQLLSALPEHLTSETISAFLTAAARPLDGDLPSIGMLPNHNGLVIYQMVPTQYIDAEGLVEAIGRFIEYWRLWS